MAISDYLKKASEVIKTEVNDIKDMATSAYKKNKLKRELEEMYAVLGRIRFSELSEGNENSEESQKIFDEINRIQTELDEISREEQAKKPTCKACGKEIEENVKFCPYCGTEIGNEV